MEKKTTRKTYITALIPILIAVGMALTVHFLGNNHHSTENVVVGNPAVFDGLQAALKVHGDSQAALTTDLQWDAVKMPIRTITRGRYLLRSFGLPGQTVSFLSTTNDEFIAVHQHVGDAHPTIDFMRGISGPKTPYLLDRALFEALFTVQTYVMNSRGYFSILKGAQYSKGIAGSEQSGKLPAILYQNLAGPFRHLQKRYEAVIADKELRERYNDQDPDMLPFMKAMVIASKKKLLMTEAEYKEIAERATNAGKLMKDALEPFRWKDKPLTRAEFYQTLGETSHAADRRKLVEEYSAAVLAAHRQGLIPNITWLNTLARKYGYDNYAEYAGDVIYGLKPAEFDALLQGFYNDHKDALEEFLGMLSELSNAPLYEWDVHYYANVFVEGLTQGAGIPKLTFHDGLAAAKRFYKDIGIDLDAAPFAGNIIYDMKKRADKYGNAFAAGIDDGTQAWFNTNFDPESEITLENLSTVVHELAHDVHIIMGAQNARGNISMGIRANPSTWIEGIAYAIDNLVMTKAWLDRYLAHLPQFADEQTRKAVAAASTGLTIYEHLMVLSRARFEISLYQDRDEYGNERSIEERLNYWSVLAKQFMHVETMPGSQGGRVYATPHFASLPCYYISYEGGFPTARATAQDLYDGLRTGNLAQMRKGGIHIRHLMGLGARITSLEDISNRHSREGGNL